MKLKEIKDALFRLREEKYRLQMEYEENEGEVTESTLSREQAIEDIKVLLKSKEGIDNLGRLVRSNQEDIQCRKDEIKHLNSEIKRIENFNDYILELSNEVLEEIGEDKAKGNLGYSFGKHTSVTTKVDTKVLKELFYDKVETVIRESGVIPEDVTFSLSASVSRLPEGVERPSWYETSTIGKATFRKPLKAKDDEFNVTDF
jgi:hypothetical protein